MQPQSGASITSISCKLGHIIFKKKCPHCKSFQKDWYTALKDAGFIDIESGDRIIDHGNPSEIVQRHKDFHSQIAYEAKVNYYQWARAKATEGRFASQRDYMLWGYHAEAVPQRTIAERVGLHQSVISRRLGKISSYLSMSSSSLLIKQLSFPVMADQ